MFFSSLFMVDEKNIEKKPRKIWRLKKKPYLCTRFREIVVMNNR